MQTMIRRNIAPGTHFIKPVSICLTPSTSAGILAGVSYSRQNTFYPKPKIDILIFYIKQLA